MARLVGAGLPEAEYPKPMREAELSNGEASIIVVPDTSFTETILGAGRKS